MLESHIRFVNITDPEKSISDESEICFQNPIAYISDDIFTFIN